MKRFVEWDSFELRVDGGRVNEMVRAQVGSQEPLERVELKFTNGLLQVVGSVKKWISIPFTVDITHIYAKGTTVYVPLGKISAAGFPIPTLLVSLIKSKLPADLVSYQEPATFVVSLERFLPPFVSLEIQNIWIIDGGLAVTLGRGGADLPAGGSSTHEQHDS